MRRDGSVIIMSCRIRQTLAMRTWPECAGTALWTPSCWQEETWVARMSMAMQQDVYVVDGMFGLVDEACEGEGLPDRAPGSDWVHASSGSVFLETADSLIIQARLRVEVWDGSAEIDEAYWPDQVCLSLNLPTARLLVDQSDAGSAKGPQLPSPGRGTACSSRRTAAPAAGTRPGTPVRSGARWRHGDCESVDAKSLRNSRGRHRQATSWGRVSSCSSGLAAP